MVDVLLQEVQIFFPRYGEILYPKFVSIFIFSKRRFVEILKFCTDCTTRRNVPTKFWDRITYWTTFLGFSQLLYKFLTWLKTGFKFSILREKKKKMERWNRKLFQLEDYFKAVRTLSCFMKMSPRQKVPDLHKINFKQCQINVV